MTNISQSDRVIIAGAGPVGCTAALMLAQASIPVTLLEAEATLPTDMRASTFHPPSLDMLGRLGLTQRLIPQGMVAPLYQYRDRRSGEYAEFDLSVLSGIVGHPYRLQCEQFKLTQTAADMLAAYPHVDLRMSSAVASAEATTTGVRVTTESPSGSDTLQGRFLIGADGARSIVRKYAEIEFEGFTYPELFLVVSTTYALEQHFENLSPVNYIADATEWCTLLRVPSCWRVLFPTDPDASPETLTDPDAIEARMQRLAPKQGHHRIEHTSLYRIHQRVAKHYRNGNILLAGDAAHVNNPLGGMGMNGGLHDAINLCEKLIGIITRNEPMESLDLYERQRRTITVDFIQAQTIQNKKTIEETNDEARLQRIRDLRAIAADKTQAIAFLRRNNMIDSVERSYAIT